MTRKIRRYVSSRFPLWLFGFVQLFSPTCLNFMQLDRKPSKCVVFEDDPRGVTAAHNCTMMAVALIGAYPAWVFPPLSIRAIPCRNRIIPLMVHAEYGIESFQFMGSWNFNADWCWNFCRYDLEQADLAVGSFNELSVINLRRLFAHRGSNFMDLQKQIVEKAPPRRRITTDTIFWFISNNTNTIPTAHTQVSACN